MKTIIQVSNWNPFESYLLIASLMAGISGLFFSRESSRVITKVLPGWILIIWYLGLIVGATLAIIGIHFNLVYKLHLEMMGVSILCGITLGYSALIAINGGRALAYPVISISFFGLACIARQIQLYRAIRRLKKESEVIV